MPLHPVALEVLRETGPMAVSSANKVGQPAAITAEEARDQLGYVGQRLSGGRSGARPGAVSTIVDLTGEVPRLLRAGAIPLEKLREVVPDILGAGRSLSAALHRPARLHGQHLPVADGRAAARCTPSDGRPLGDRRRTRSCTSTAPAPAAGTRARR